ncbi:hypothetical protein N0V86_000765 [Didymella sp. IMI 355093]|nr:hypothetical protein N0V86_000765 [Didymella sp. IMI 355093]
MFNTPSLSKSPPPLRAANSPRSPALHFEEAPSEEISEEQDPQPEEAAADDDIPYPEPSSEQTLLPPPNFRPFFALVEDSTSGEHYHPYVHYVFADDDPVIVTAASMRGMGLDDTQYLPHDTPQTSNDLDQGLMLRIEGVEIPGKKKGKGKGQPGDTILSEARERTQGDMFAALDGLVEGVEGSLTVAGKITSFGAREQQDNAQADSEAVIGKKSTVEHPELPLDFDRTG